MGMLVWDGHFGVTSPGGAGRLPRRTTLRRVRRSGWNVARVLGLGLAWAGFLGLLMGVGGGAGCGNKSGGGGNHNTNNENLAPCPEGTTEHEVACMPDFDECPAVDEIPVLGGGCLPVGVERCALGEGCAPGFEGDGAGGCVAVRPTAQCGAGEMAVLGQTSCQPIRDCGSGTWGSIQTGPDTVYVDAGYTGGASDGSASAPFTTIADALAVVSSGGQIAIAEGTYPERVTLDQPVSLVGRCPGRVTLEATSVGGQDPPVVTVGAAASGALIRGVRLTGPGPGVMLDEAVDVRVREVEIADAGHYGVFLQRGATAALRRVKITGARTAGLLAYGGAVTLADSVVRGTRPTPDGSFGRGLDLGCDHFGDGGCPTLDATRIIVEQNHESGILLAGGQATVTDSLVADTQANAGHGQAGIGIQTQCDTTSADCPTLTVTGSVLAGNRAAGIMALGTVLTVTDTVIRDTQPQSGDQRFGSGLVAQCDPSLSVCEPLVATCLLLRGNHQTGLTVAGIEADVAGALIRDTEAQQSNLKAGQGVIARCEQITGFCTDLALSDSGLMNNTYGSIFLQGSRLALTGSYVGQTRPGAEADEEGLALYAQCDTSAGSCPDLEIDASLLEEHRAEGIALYGGTARMTRSTVRDVSPQASDDEFGFGIYVDGQTVTTAPTFDASACDIANATVSGMFFYQAGGEVRRSWIHGAEYSVVLSEDSAVLEDNVLEGTTQDEPLEQ